MLDDRIRAVLRRLEERDGAPSRTTCPVGERSLQIEPSSGALLYSLCAGRPGCEVLEDRRLPRLLDDLARSRCPRPRRARPPRSRQTRSSSRPRHGTSPTPGWPTRSR